MPQPLPVKPMIQGASSRQLQGWEDQRSQGMALAENMVCLTGTGWPCHWHAAISCFEHAKRQAPTTWMMLSWKDRRMFTGVASERQRGCLQAKPALIDEICRAMNTSKAAGSHSRTYINIMMSLHSAPAFLLPPSRLCPVEHICTTPS